MTDYTPKKAPRDSGVNRTIPDPRERVWVVIVSNYELRADPEDEDATMLALQPLYALAPKGGGPASVFDSGTWHDRSMARQRLGMVADRLRKDRRVNLHQQVLRLGFVTDERLYWADGERVSGERVERAA